MDRIRSGRNRSQDARALVSAARAPLDRLTSALARFDDARAANPPRLSYHFSMQDTVFTESDDRALHEAKSGRTALPIECLNAWTDALEAARDAQKLHETRRSSVGRPNANQLLARGAGAYRDQVQDTIREFRRALELTAQYADTDTQREIERVAREL